MKENNIEKNFTISRKVIRVKCKGQKNISNKCKGFLKEQKKNNNNKKYGK